MIYYNKIWDVILNRLLGFFLDWLVTDVVDSKKIE